MLMGLWMPLLSVSAIFGDAKLILPFMATRKSAWVVVGPVFVSAMGLLFASCGDGRSPDGSPSPTSGPEITPEATQASSPFDPEPVETLASLIETGAEAIWNPLD